MIQSGGFLVRLLGPLLKTLLPFIKNVIKPLPKGVLIPLGLTAAAAAADTRIHKKILGSCKRPLDLALPKNTTLIISNDEMKDIIEMVKSLKDSGLLLKGVSEAIENEAKEQKRGFLSTLLGTLGASLLGNILAGKGAIATRQGRGVNRAGEGVAAKSISEETESKRQGRGIVRAGYGNKKIQKTTTKNKMDF